MERKKDGGRTGTREKNDRVRRYKRREDEGGGKGRK